MEAASSWDMLDPFNQVRVVDTGPAAVKSSSTPGLAMISPNAVDHDPPWHPDNPLFWFGAVLAVTFGLIAVSTSVKVGPFKAAVSAGDAK